MTVWELLSRAAIGYFVLSIAATTLAIRPWRCSRDTGQSLWRAFGWGKS